MPRKRAPGKSRQSPRGAPPAPSRRAAAKSAVTNTAVARSAVTSSAVASRAATSRAANSRPAARVRRPPPYIKCIQRSGRVAAWQVDGAYVRGKIDAEFRAFGHHYSFSPIPRNEIWIDAEQGSDEQRLLIAQAAIERRLMARGMDFEAARAVAIAEERRQRLKST